MAELKWSDGQWETVNNAVTEAFGKASVAGAFLPCYGPLSASTEYVRREQITVADEDAMVTVEDDRTLKLFNLTVNVKLSSEQVAEESLSSALLSFRRAANTLAQVEDYIVFNGFTKAAADAAKTRTPDDRQQAKAGADAAEEQARTAVAAAEAAHTAGPSEDTEREMIQKAKEWTQAKRKKLDAVTDEKLRRVALIAVSRPDVSIGLAEAASSGPGYRSTPYAPSVDGSVAGIKATGSNVGDLLVSAIVQSVAQLEDDSHPGPFACVLGSHLFEEAYRPIEKSMVLPADRITPILGGPLLRSGQMDSDTGILVSLAANDVDIVVATPPTVQFLQVTLDAKYLFRVYEKFTLRIKDVNRPAVSRLDLLSSSS